MFCWEERGRKTILSASWCVKLQKTPCVSTGELQRSQQEQYFCVLLSYTVQNCTVLNRRVETNFPFPIIYVISFNVAGLPNVKVRTTHLWESYWRTNVTEYFNENKHSLLCLFMSFFVNHHLYALIAFLTIDYLAAFREFLQSEFSEENIEFWLACREYRESTAPAHRFLRATDIYQEFLHPMAVKEVRQTKETKLFLHTEYVIETSWHLKMTE